MAQDKLSYAPSASGNKQAMTGYLEVSDAACKRMYISAAPMSITASAAIYRDIELSAEVPLGSPPCNPGVLRTALPASK